jgi:hypothetical protein
MECSKTCRIEVGYFVVPNRLAESWVGTGMIELDTSFHTKERTGITSWGPMKPERTMPSMQGQQTAKKSRKGTGLPITWLLARVA